MSDGGDGRNRAALARQPSATQDKAELLRAAGIDPARFAALSEYEQRVVLRVAEQLRLARDEGDRS
ncbi:MAG: hypothetical protein FJX61_09510 [Alphaproteobacteria bacterium]|nr:hypothetical protein [Alphaproteobacteria bacterium]